jgi:hypothetical protein
MPEACNHRRIPLMPPDISVFCDKTGGLPVMNIRLQMADRANDLDRINKLVKIQTWHVEKFAEFIKKMAETPEMARDLCSTIRSSCTART